MAEPRETEAGVQSFNERGFEQSRVLVISMDGDRNGMEVWNALSILFLRHSLH